MEKYYINLIKKGKYKLKTKLLNLQTSFYS